VLVTSHDRRPGEIRQVVIYGGRLALCELRQQRTDAIAAASSPDRQ
jgi:hypothetical protein